MPGMGVDSTGEGIMKTIAFRYGLLDPLNWDQDCHEHLFLMNRLWNTLVEIERKHRDRYREIVGSDEAVEPIHKQIAELKAEQAALREERKRRRKVARARVQTPEIDDRLREIATNLQTLTAEAKAVRVEAKERMREPLKALNTEHFEAVKSARQNSGLWWGNYNAIIASYETARSRAMKDGAELRYRRFTGEGRFTVQIVGGASVDEITSGKKQASIDLLEQPVPGRGGKPLPRLSITVYTKDGDPRLLTFPIVYDRPLPDGCRVQMVTVTRRRCATRWQYAAVFTCRVERPSVSTVNERECAINLGFRQVPGDRPGSVALKVATLYDGERCETLELPSRWMYRMDDIERIQQQRDEGLVKIVDELRAQWPNRPQEFRDCTDIEERLSRLLQTPRFSPNKLAGITLRWRDQHPDVWPDMLDELERWRKLDKLDVPRQGGWEIQANKRDKLLLQRREIYRLFARRIAQEYGVIRIGKMDLRKMAQIESSDGTETELHQLARRNRQRAALYQLQQEIKLQAEKFGALVEIIDGPFTVTCNSCGSRCAVTADRMHACEHCSAVWDQDENAARNILAAHRERSGSTPNSGEGSQPADQSLTRAERMRMGKEKRRAPERSQVDSQGDVSLG